MENWPTAGDWPTTGLYPPDGSYGGGNGDNHYLPGGGDSPIDDQVPSEYSCGVQLQNTAAEYSVQSTANRYCMNVQKSETGEKKKER